MNLVDEAKKKIEERHVIMEEVEAEEIDLAEKKEKLKDNMEATTDMDSDSTNTSNTNSATTGDASIGGAL